MNASDFVHKKEYVTHEIFFRALHPNFSRDFKCLRTLFSGLQQQQLQAIDSSNPIIQPLLRDDEEKPLELGPIRAPESAEDGSRKLIQFHKALNDIDFDVIQ
jgi:hypothetical protein